jgi:ParB-like chromosome segregation protein Spo0J
MTELPFHPIASIFPLMEGEEFDQLVADVKANGQRELITVYQNQVLDGRNRARACHALGMEPRLTPFTGDDDAARAFVISKNLHRRHLTAADKRKVIVDLIKAQPQKSDRQIAEMLKVSPTYVGKVRTEMEAAGDVSTVDTRKDKRGRDQPARKKRKREKEPDGDHAGDNAGDHASDNADTNADTNADANAGSPEASAEARKKENAARDNDPTREPPRAEVAKLVRAWVAASPEAQREFVRERWDEIARLRKQLDANGGAAHEDHWVEGDTP